MLIKFILNDVGIVDMFEIEVLFFEFFVDDEIVEVLSDIVFYFVNMDFEDKVLVSL